MAYDEELAARIRDLLAGREGVTEKKMFGGIGFMMNGNMCCGVMGDDLILRLDGARGEEALAEPHTRPLEQRGKAMKSWMLVSRDGVATEAGLRVWVERAATHAASLPRK